MSDLIFTDWETLGHVAICAAIAYIVLFLFIRISGKRTIAKLTPFDFVVTVTLGSTLSSMILAKVTISEGAVALAVIIALQYLFAWMARKSGIMERAINSAPTLVFYNGNFIKEAMAKEFITREEVYAAVRNFGLEKMEDVKAVIMEINGEITVVKDSGGSAHTSLEDIELS